MSIVKLPAIRLDHGALSNEIDEADRTRKKPDFAAITVSFEHVDDIKILDAKLMSRENEHCDIFPISPASCSASANSR